MIAMERFYQFLALVGIVAAATVATANASARQLFIPPWFADIYDDQLATYNAALFPAGPPEQEERADILIQQASGLWFGLYRQNVGLLLGQQ